MVLAWKGWKNTKDCLNYSENTNKPVNLTKVINRFNKTDKTTLKTYTPITAQLNY